MKISERTSELVLLHILDRNLAGQGATAESVEQDLNTSLVTAYRALSYLVGRGWLDSHLTVRGGAVGTRLPARFTISDECSSWMIASQWCDVYDEFTIRATFDKERRRTKRELSLSAMAYELETKVTKGVFDNG